MAVTKILARKARLDTAIEYALNGDKTNEYILTAHQNCEPGREARQMLQTKEDMGKTDGVQCYHIIQSFRPGEITPELALEIARQFAAEHLTEFEAVIGVHVDREHIHAHIVFNSVSCVDGHKYHSNARSYYRQIRSVSDRLCREHGLSVIMQGEASKTVSYVEWLRESRGQPTFRAMLEIDLRTAIEDANDLGHFYMLMEHMGYEISHGKNLGFRLRGQEHFTRPGRKNPLFTEDGIRNAILGNLEDIETGRKPAVSYRPPYRPYRKHTKYTGFLALYYHYVYLLGSIQKRQYPPKMMPRLKAELMKFEQYKAQFALLRDNGVTDRETLHAFQTRTEETLATLMKQRTILNVRKKKRRPLFTALANEEALAPVSSLYAEGMTGIEAELSEYMAAVKLLDGAGVSREALTAEKAGIYEELAELNQAIKKENNKLALCKDIFKNAPHMEQDIRAAEEKEVMIDGSRRR